MACSCGVNDHVVFVPPIERSLSLMPHSTSVATARRGPRFRMLLVAALVLAFSGAMASNAWATLEIQSYNNPAGDATLQTYALYNEDGSLRGGLKDGLNPFTLTEGERRSVGPVGGVYIWQAMPAAGWKVADIQCLHVDPGTGNAIPTLPGEFNISIAQGRVTINHQDGQDEYCAFTNVKISVGGTGGGGGGSGSTPGSGVSPTLPGTVSGSLSQGKTALLRVLGGVHFAKAQVRISRKSTIKLTLLKGKKVVGTARYTRKAGTPTLRVKLRDSYRRSLARQGRKKVTLTLKITVVGSNHATKTFRYGVVVKI
jgi:hypothetical protein